jgi:outer membrane protein assembly factor BamD (BamD/ComL family)
MLKYKILLAIWLVVLAITASNTCAAVWRLTDKQEFETVSDKPDDKFLLAVAQVKTLVNTGQTEEAQKAYDQLRGDFPDLAGPDFDAFVKADMYYSQGMFTTAVRAYDKFLKDYPMSRLYDAALDREFSIATAYLGGHKKTVLKILKLSGYAEGVKIMEKITTEAGYYSPIGVKAAIAVAEHYEERQKYDEAYLKWNEVSAHWLVGRIGKQALLGMARSQYSSYNAPPEHKRAFYEVSRLSTARTQYEKFQKLFPDDAKELGIADILEDINEQMAYKQYTTAAYYDRVGKKQAASLYYDMVLRNWPGTKAGAMARKKQRQSPQE